MVESGSPKSAIDIGVGRSCYIKKLGGVGITTTVVDAASHPLEELKDHVSAIYKGCLPYLNQLDDEKFDLLICTEVIALLPSSLHRLAVSELARLISRRGEALISTPLDLYSEDALERFITLIETEFAIEEIKLGFDRIYLFFLRLFQYPSKIERAKRDHEYRTAALGKRRGASRRLFLILLHLPSLIICLFRAAFTPFFLLLQGSERSVRFLQILSKALFGPFGVTHAILRVKPKKLF